MVSEKFYTRKCCISSKINHIQNKAKPFLFEKKKNDPAELAEISFCIKNVLGKNENL